VDKIDQNMLAITSLRDRLRGPWYGAQEFSGATVIISNSRGEKIGEFQTEYAWLVCLLPDLIATFDVPTRVADETHAHWDNDQDSKVGKHLLAIQGSLIRYRADLEVYHGTRVKLAHAMTTFKP
jgi:hypothetical protein